MFKIASWNVNSLKVRLEHVLDWLEQTGMDVLAIQETKTQDENFPVERFKERGYELVYSGQKTYNGVAVVAKSPITEVVTDIPGLDDPQRRILAVTIEGIRIINLYVPNGSEVGSDKYQYKLSWLEKIREYIAEQLKIYPRLLVLGDFNIAPEDIDVHDPDAWEGKVLVSAPEREALQAIMNLGLKDSFRALSPEEQCFSWWDYRAAGFRRNLGLRIDHVLLSEPLMQECKQAVIDVEPRRWERPSDHAPVWVGLGD